MAYKPKNTNERILHRLKIAQGHLKKIISMVENDTYCIDVMHQSNAVQIALKQTDALILENHLRTCVVEHMQSGKEEKAVEEIIKVFKRT